MTEPAASRKPRSILRAVGGGLASARLALGLLVAVLGSCVAGVTVFRGADAWDQVFSTLWFNGLLVLLVVNVAFCFFGRIRGRRLTLVSAGMILFHLSFVALFLAVVYDGLFYFRGVIRLTEGERLPNAAAESYDTVQSGRFFDWSSLSGWTRLVRMRTGFRVDGEDKRAAYEVAVGEEGAETTGLVFTTQHLERDGVRYFRDKEGYSVLLALYRGDGELLYRAFVSLQSLRQQDGSFVYTSGSRRGPGAFPYPQEPAPPRFLLQVAYRPDPRQERAGTAMLSAWPLHGRADGAAPQLLAGGQVALGERLAVGEYAIAFEEVRYWAALAARRDPGQPVVLASLWVGLGGLVLTFVGRLGRSGRRAAPPLDPSASQPVETVTPPAQG